MSDRGQAIAIAAIIFGVIGLSFYYFNNLRGLDIQIAEETADNYLDNLNDPDLAVGEIMEFQYNYYVIYYEESTGVGAFEMLIDKDSGHIFPEYGPNMMWNLKYGHGGIMGPGGPGSGSGNPMPATQVMDEDMALEIAQGFLDSAYPGSEAEDPHPFYGYYTVHALRDGEIFGMLSVNQYTGETWFHNWHGEYINSG
jgi:hypothetical protein